MPSPASDGRRPFTASRSRLGASFLVNLDRPGHDPGPLVGHEVVVAEHVHIVLEIALHEVAQPLASASEYQDHEPLDEQANLRDYAIDQ